MTMKEMKRTFKKLQRADRQGQFDKAKKLERKLRKALGTLC